MATKIQLRRDTAANWTASNPVLSQGEVGFELDTGLLKIGDGVNQWGDLAYFTAGITDFSAIAESLLPSTDSEHSLGAADRRWKDLFVSDGSIYIGDIKLSNTSGKLSITQVSNPGEGTEEPIPGGNEAYQLPIASNTILGAIKVGNNLSIAEDGTLNAEDGNYTLSIATGSVLGGIRVGNNLTIDGMGTLSAVVPDISNFITAEDIPAIPEDVSDLTDTQGLLGQGSGTVDLTVTVPGDPYKGFGARYGRVYANSSTNELTVSKIVIYKDTSITASTIDSQGGRDDDFAVTGLGDSDVVAMFVLYGDTNSEKSLDTLKAFTRTAIDTVILASGEEGNVNTIEAMRLAFYTNIATLTAAAGGLVANFEFFNYDTSFSVNADLSGQGTGSSFSVNSLNYNLVDDTISVNSWGQTAGGYTQGDVIIIPGTSISYQGTPLLSPDNDVTITITEVNISGFITSFTASGTLPRPPAQWPENSISDGGEDQYDTGNYINTNLAQEISYASGVIVEDATAQFGAGSKYVAVYDNSVFGIFATGSSATTMSTSGGSGADGNSTTDTGELFATDRTYDPALTNLTLTNYPLRAIPINFVKLDNATFDNVDIIEDDSTLQIGVTRGVNQGIYNPFTEEGWNEAISPQGTLWSVGNTIDLSNIKRRTYTTFYAAYGGNLGNVVPGSKAIMFVPSIEKYYLIEWLSWTQGDNGGGFSYTRTEIDATQVEQGLRFSDGTVLTTAEGLGRVKSTASGNRRIEEVAGYKEVSFTELSYTTIIGVTSRSATDTSILYVTNPNEIVTITDNYSQYVENVEDMEFSLDNTTWYRWNGGATVPEGEYGYFFVENPTLTYNQGDTVYFRYQTGGLPVVWWSKAELPGGATDFRGAVIDYHAYTGDGTIIGTIHIVDDSGERRISHSEVASGSSDCENDDLWLVQNEGSISYRRIDGEERTLKIHWTAKVFYGSEYYD
jgi:hypothetical protein